MYQNGWICMKYIRKSMEKYRICMNINEYAWNNEERNSLRNEICGWEEDRWSC